MTPRLLLLAAVCACNGDDKPGDDDTATPTDDTGCETPGTWYADADGDGYGDPDAGVEACEAPDGQVADATDCDDGDDTVHPGADEDCDEVDRDCDGSPDDGATDPATWYPDGDGDGYGTDDGAVVACEAPGSGYDTHREAPFGRGITAFEH